MEIARIIEQWLYGRPRLTQQAYLRDVSNALSKLGIDDLRQVDLPSLQFYQTYLLHDRRLTDRTVCRKMSAVRSLLKFAYEQSHITSNPAKALRSPKVHENLQERILTKEQVLAIIDAATCKRHQLLLLCTYALGARAAEICGLQWRDITPRPNGGAVVRLLGKRDKWRSVKLPPSIWADLSTIRGDSADDERVFRMQRKRAHYIMKRAVRASGAPAEASLHWLRHSNASHALDAGAPIHVVRDSLGHASVQTTDKYLHSRPEQSSSDYLGL